MIAPAVNGVPCVLVSRPRICAETPGNTALGSALLLWLSLRDFLAPLSRGRQDCFLFCFCFCVARLSSIESGASTLLLASARKGKFVSR